MNFYSIDIGQILYDEGLITAEELKISQKKEKDENISLSEALVKLKYVSENEILLLAAKHLKIILIDLEKYDISPEVIKLIPVSILKELGIVPIKIKGDTLFIATSREMNKGELNKLQERLKLAIKCCLTTEKSILKILNEN